MDFENIIIMKYGVHAAENVDSIINRKHKEYQEVGYLSWGYGGTICNPLTQIHPFLEENQAKGEDTYLLLVRTESDYNIEGKRGKYYSRDKKEWLEIPDAINIISSKYALFCEDLIPCDFELNLKEYKIAVGKSQNKILSDYFKGRVDKACAIKEYKCRDEENVKVSWYAKVIDAVFVRGDNE